MVARVRVIGRVAGRYPALLALLAQLCAALLVGGVIVMAGQFSNWRPSGLAAGLILGLLAAGLGRWFGLASWWWWLNLGFVPVLLLFSGAALPSWVFLVGFLLLLLGNWNSVGERVPLYLTGARSRQQLAEWLVRQPADFRFVDLGCGPQQRVAGKDFGDFVVWRHDNVPSYQIAVVVDDHAMGITEVVRGSDLLLSTARQLLLYRALGFADSNMQVLRKTL